MNSRQINPERLQSLLESRGLKQRELADKIGVDVGTLSRWKRGKQTKLHTSHLAKLCEALGTTSEVLCGDGPLPVSDDRQKPPKGQVTLMLDHACRNALGLVARRYGVTRQQIVEVAPLLFMIMAEQSLKERREEIVAWIKKRREAWDQAPKHLKHSAAQIDDGEYEALISAAGRSIKKRDLFAVGVGGWSEDYAEINPFAEFLTARLSEISKRQPAPEKLASWYKKNVTWDHGGAPSYMIGLEELVALLGSDREAVRHVLEGKVVLAEMPGETRRGTPEERAAWVKQTAEDAAREREALLKEAVERAREETDFDWAEAIAEVIKEKKSMENDDL